jgi:2-hydroxycyclohexanecarboxyl-CoA dehydrogenase
LHRTQQYDQQHSNPQSTLTPKEKPMQRFDGKTVIVTGGGGGIGGATCRRFASEGAQVAVFDMNLEAAEKVAADIRAGGGQAAAFACNITDRAQVDAAVAAAQTQLGPIAVLVNNAGWDVFKPFLKTVPAEWEKLIAINLTGALHMLHAVLPGMVERKYGRIVNVASDAARGGSSGEAVYSACKGGLVALSKTLAREHARQSITVNVVCPGPTDTALLAGVAEGARDPAKLIEAFRSAIPLGRLGQGDDLASAIAFFGSDDAGFVTGQVLSVSGGLTMHG